MKSIVTALLAAALVLAADAASFEAEKAYSEGLANYTNLNFEAAAQCFRRAIASGLDTAALRYDLGNAAYKQGRLGEAIAAYRASLNLAPRDADCLSNLQRALSQTEDSLTADRMPEALRSFLFLYYYLGMEEQAAIAALSWIAAWLLLIVALLAGHRSSAPRKLAVAAFLIAALFTAAAACRYVNASRHAVITVPTAKVHAGPADSYTELFILHDGAEARIADREGSWVKIAIRLKEDQVKAGWVESSQLQTVL